MTARSNGAVTAVVPLTLPEIKVKEENEKDPSATAIDTSEVAPFDDKNDNDEEVTQEEDDEDEKPYDVADFYWKDEADSPLVGRLSARLATNHAFGISTLGVIGLNAVWIGIDTDWNDASDITKAETWVLVGENFFCVFFTFELVVRFLAFEVKRNCLKDGWFKFDGGLVALMIFETWIMFIAGGGGGLSQLSLLRMLRLLRLTRMARLMRSMPELLTLVKGMVSATRSVFSTLVLLVTFLYLFAIVFTQEYRDKNSALEEDFGPNMFGSIGLSMLTLFVNGTLLDNLLGVMLWLREDSQLLMWVFGIFVLISSFTVLNMLIGVVCEVVSATSAREIEDLAEAEAKRKLKAVFKEVDVDKSGMVSQIEFESMVKDPDSLNALKELGIEAYQLKDLAGTLFMALDDDHPVEPVTRKNAWESSPSHSRANSKETPAGTSPKEGSPARLSIRSDTKGNLPPGTVELSFPQFLDRLSHLKPGTSANVLDFADLQKQLLLHTTRAKRTVSELQAKMEMMGAPLPEIGATRIDELEISSNFQDVRCTPISGPVDMDLSSVTTEVLLKEVGRRMARGSSKPAR